MKTLLTILGIIIAVACSRPINNFTEPQNKLAEVQKAYNFRTGDLVVRSGTGIISDMFRKFSLHDQKYSHAGLLSVEDGRAYVYHTIGGEENVTNKLRKETLESFCNPLSNEAAAIYRYPLTKKEEENVAAKVQYYYKEGLEFDTKLDLETDEKMYCSEFVYKVISRCTANKNMIPLTSISGISYVAIDNLYINAFCKPICSFNLLSNEN